MKVNLENQIFDKVINSFFSSRKVVIVLLVGLSLYFAGASQAQAAACSKYDRGMWNENELNNVNYFTGMAFIGRGILQPNTDDNMNAAIDLMDQWVKKNKKQKS